MYKATESVEYYKEMLRIKEKTIERLSNEIKELKSAGVDIRDKAAVKAYYEEKAKKEAEAAEIAKKEEEEKAAADRLANPTTEDLLKQIKALLEQNLSK